MKVNWSEHVRPRVGLFLVELLGVVWFHHGGSFFTMFAVLGIIGTVGFVVWRRRPVALGWLLGWGYWLLLGWKGEPIRQSMAHTAVLWHGDGSTLSTMLAITGAMVYTAIMWRPAASGIEEFALFAALVGGQAKPKKNPEQDWAPITFVLGENKSSEDFKLGGE